MIFKDRKFGLYTHTICGLNIFSSNHIEIYKFEDPRIVFLRALCAQEAISAHTGNLGDFADTPEEIFGLRESANYETVPIGIYGGYFYDVSSFSYFPSCYFEDITSENNFWKIGENSDFDVLDVLCRDAIAFYIGQESDVKGKMEELFNSGFVSHEKWVSDVTRIYKNLILSGGDNSIFTIYADKKENFDVLSYAIKAASATIENHQWYQSNYSELEWDEKYNTCLMRKGGHPSIDYR